MGIMDLLRKRPSQPQAFTKPPSIADMHARRTTQLNSDEAKRADQNRILIDAVNRVLGATEFSYLDHAPWFSVYGHDGKAAVKIWEPHMLVGYYESIEPYYRDKRWVVTAWLAVEVPGRYQYETETETIHLPQPPTHEDVRRLCPEYDRFGEVTGVISITYP